MSTPPPIPPVNPSAPSTPARVWPTNLAKFPVRPFTPDNGLNGPGVMMLIGALVITGGVVGFIAHFIAQYFYLIIMFPLLIGFALGGVGVLMVRKGRLRNAWVGGLAGFLGGVLAMGMMHYFDFQTYRTAFVKEADLAPLVEITKLPPAEREAEIATYEEDAPVVRRLVNGYLSFPAYMNMEAENGVMIKGSRGGSSDKGMNLGYTGSWIYWGVETLIVAGITFFVVRKETQKPYCRACDDWRVERTLGGFNGDVSRATAGVQSGDLNDLAAADPGPYGAVTLTSASCVQCRDAEPMTDLKLEQVTVDAKGNQSKKTLSQATWPAAALPALTELFTAPPAENAVPVA